MQRPVLVLDLDGTVCLGEGPIHEYARAIEALVPSARGLADAVVSFLGDPNAQPDLLVAQDGYEAVQLLSELAGVSREQRDEAYRRSRLLLHADVASVHPPAGLTELLAELDDVRIVLITNAPGSGLEPLLEHLGVGALLDEVRTSAGKPAGMRRLLEELLAAHGLTASPGHLLSVGDIWANDLAPALELGCATAYVDTFGRRRGPAHATAATLPELYPALREWATDPAAFVRDHPLPQLTAAGPDRPGRD